MKPWLLAVPALFVIGIVAWKASGARKLPDAPERGVATAPAAKAVHTRSISVPEKALAEAVDRTEAAATFGGTVLTPERATEIYKSYLQTFGGAMTRYTLQLHAGGLQRTVTWAQAGADGIEYQRNESSTLYEDGKWRTNRVVVTNAEGDWDLIGAEAILVPRDPHASTAKEAAIDSEVSVVSNLGSELKQQGSPPAPMSGFETTINEVPYYILDAKFPPEQVKTLMELMQKMGKLDKAKADVFRARFPIERIFVIEKESNMLMAEYWVGQNGVRTLRERYDERSFNEQPPKGAFEIPPMFRRQVTTAAGRNAAVQKAIQESAGQ